jgi:hypothetical protein
VRRKVTLLGSIYAGDSMVGRGRAINKRDESSRHLVEPASHRRSPRRHHPAPT